MTNKKEAIVTQLLPLFYLLIWVLCLGLAYHLLGQQIVGSPVFITSSLAILFIGVVSKSTSWSIGGNNGIRGDSLGKYVEFHSGGNPPWNYKLFTDNAKEGIEKVELSERGVVEINKIVADTERQKQQRG